MSINVLMGTPPHCAADDLESFFYVLLFLCLEYSGPGRRRDWDICKTELRRWIEGNFASIGEAKSSDVTKAQRFQTIVLDNIPPYFHDLRNCLDNLRRYIFHESELKNHPPTHAGLIDILVARSKEPFDETVKEDATSSIEKSKRRGRGFINTGSRRTESESEGGSESHAGDSDVEEDGYAEKRDGTEEEDDEGSDSLQDDNEDEDYQPAKRNRPQAHFSRSEPSDPALTGLSQLRPVRSFVLQRQSGPPTASYQPASLTESRAARSSSGLPRPAARSFNSEPIPPAHFYASAKLPLRRRRR
jgi:hypothetical protein